MLRRRFIYTVVLVCFCWLNTYASLRERVYVQTDKELYMAGELVWLKLYTTNEEGKLIPFSKVGYVELINDSIPEVQIKVDIQNGTGTGWIELPALLPSGYYRLVAYTRYMRNENESVFFEKHIGIINPFSSDRQTNRTDHVIQAETSKIKADKTPLRIATDQVVYTTRNKGKITISGLPDENISLGVSISGIEPAGYKKEGKDIAIWKEQLEDTKTTEMNNLFPPEYEGAIIEGKVIDLNTQQESDVNNIISLLSFPGKEMQVFAGKPDGKGNVSFFTQHITGKHELASTSIDLYERKHRIDIVPPFVKHTAKSSSPLIPDIAWLDYLQKRSLGLQVVQAYMADSLSRIKETKAFWGLKPSRRYMLDDYTRFPSMADLFIEYILTARIRTVNGKKTFFAMNDNMNGYTNGMTLVLLDNIPVADHELLLDYNPLLIKSIDVYFGRYIFGGQAFDGIVFFSSYNNNYPGFRFKENTQLFDYEGTQPYRYFYVPSYNDETSLNTRIPDFRHTLLWEPLLQSNGQQEIIIPFSTSDLPGTYRITIEGIGENGTIISEHHEFTVN